MYALNSFHCSSHNMKCCNILLLVLTGSDAWPPQTKHQKPCRHVLECYICSWKKFKLPRKTQVHNISGNKNVANNIKLCYCSTYCNTAQMWSWCTEYPMSVVKRYHAIHIILCVGEKNGKIKIVSSFSVIQRCFVINVLNNKTIILLNLVGYPLVLAHSAYGL